MKYWYKIILCENGTKSELGVHWQDEWHPPKPSQIWPVYLDGKEVHCKIVSAGNLSAAVNSEGTEVYAQEVFVKRPTD